MRSALKVSAQGLAEAARSETSFKQETLALLLAPLLGWAAGFSLPSILLVVMAWLVVMAFELLNMGIEAISDLVSPEFHPLIKKAKDAGSAAVFLLLCANACLWGYLLL